MKTRVGVAVAVVVAMAACGKGEQDASKAPPSPNQASAETSAPSGRDGSAIVIPAGLSTVHRAAAEQAKDALLTVCAATPLDWREFKDVSLTIGTAFGYLKDKFDWDLIVSVAVVYKDGLDRHRGGHRITFTFGAGNRPGIVTNKSVGIQLCAFEGRARGVVSGRPCDPNAGEDCILDVPALKVLDAARAPAVVESSRTAPPAWCFGHGFDPPHFWTCNTTEKMCKKARAAEKREESDDYRVRTDCQKAEALHCFLAESGATVCAPNPDACAKSRKEWTNLSKATSCEVATAAELEASNNPID